MRKFSVFGISLVMVLSMAAALISPSASAVAPKQVLVVGDSIPASSSDYIRFFAGMDGKVNVDVKAFGGLANCDILGLPNSTYASLSSMLAAKHYDELVVAFTGVNFFTPCAGGKLGDPLFDLYTHNAVTTQQIANAYHVPRVVWVQAPAMLNHVGITDHLNQFYGYMPYYWKTARVYNAGANITPGGQFSYVSHCMPVELHQPGCVSGQIRIRSVDGVHFYCPNGTPGGNQCASFSAGRERYGIELAGAIRANLGL